MASAASCVVFGSPDGVISAGGFPVRSGRAAPVCRSRWSAGHRYATGRRGRSTAGAACRSAARYWDQKVQLQTPLVLVLHPQNAVLIFIKSGHQNRSKLAISFPAGREADRPPQTTGRRRCISSRKATRQSAPGLLLASCRTLAPSRCRLYPADSPPARRHRPRPRG